MSPPQNTPFKKTAKTILSFVAILGAAYLINVEVQSYLGRQAAEATGLPKHTLNEALVLAKQHNKPVFAELSAVWCPACRKLDKLVLSAPEVQAALNNNYIFTRVDYDTDEGKQFARTYKARGTPTLLVLNADATPIKRLRIEYDPAEFVKQL